MLIYPVIIKNNLNQNEYSFLKGAGPRSYSDIEEIYNKYEEWYGKPDSIALQFPILQSNKNFDLYELAKGLNKPKKVDSSAVPGKSAYWKTENYEIYFDYAIPHYAFKKDSILYIDFPSIEYFMIDYDDRLNAIRDSISKTFTPQDLISMRVSNPEWSEAYDGINNTFRVLISDVMRKDREEERAVIAIKIDIIFTDIFGEELMRMENVTLEPPFPLENRNEGLTRVLSGPLNYKMPYNSFSKQGKEIIALEKHYKNKKTLIKSQINSVVFDDGSVLNKK